MKHDVFISYSTKDKAVADAVCAALESNGVNCWIAPRNIEPGTPYAREIINGIKETGLFLLLVFTSNSNMSEHVINEVDIAFNANKEIIPFMVEDVPMNPELNYYLSRKQWFVAYPDYGTKLDDFADIVFSRLGCERLNANEEERKEEARKEAERLAAEQKRREEADRKAKEEAKRKEEKERRRKEEYVKTHGAINGHEYVDMGLSVKWATCNVGASKPEDYGDYYAWGETEVKGDYSESNYAYCKRSFRRTKYDSLGGNIAGTEFDVARKKWGSTWRLPTHAEQDELINNCTLTWTRQNGVNGYKVTSKKNGNSIFLPAAGYRRGTYLDGSGSYGDYWLGSLDESLSRRFRSGANFLCFNSGDYGWGYDNRYYGFSVRPVSE